MKNINPFYYQPLILLSLAISGSAAFSQSIALSAPSEVMGRIIGPITSGQVEDGTQIKAYHLKIDRPMLLNDEKTSCGTQRIKTLPILAENMGQYKNKRVKISASIQCVEVRLGTYAIENVYSVRSAK